MLQSNSKLLKGKVVVRHMTIEGVIVSPCGENPNLKSIVCDVEFSDIQVKEHAANVTSENMLTRVDSECLLLELIYNVEDWKKD